MSIAATNDGVQNDRIEIVEIEPRRNGEFIRRAYARKRNPALTIAYMVFALLMLGAVLITGLVQPVLGLGVMATLIGLFVSTSRGLQPFVRGSLVRQEVLEVPHALLEPAGETATTVPAPVLPRSNKEGTASRALVPTVTRVDPSNGAPEGGQTVHIYGSGFTAASAVLFGKKSATFLLDGDSHIVATSAAADPDTVAVDVVVTTPTGTSPLNPNDRYTYLVPTGAWTTWHTTGLAIIVLVVFLAGYLLPSRLPISQAGTARTRAWFITPALFTLFLMIAGEGITARWSGVLIDERNRMSLSRLQLVLWTIVILSGLLTIGLANIVYAGAVSPPNTSPLAIGVPIQIWAALGISTAALVGTPLVLSTKSNKTPDPDEQMSTTANLAKQQNLNPADVGSNGLIVTKSHPKFATWSDMFRGEETGNADTLDIAKVQMFFFTAILVFAYAVAIVARLSSADLVLDKFPPFDESMVALLGISHAANITNKVAPHSQEG